MSPSAVAWFCWICPARSAYPDCVPALLGATVPCVSVGVVEVVDRERRYSSSRMPAAPMPMMIHCLWDSFGMLG
jgi:hypothetical protein